MWCRQNLGKDFDAFISPRANPFVCSYSYRLLLLRGVHGGKVLVTVMKSETNLYITSIVRNSNGAGREALHCRGDSYCQGTFPLLREKWSGMKRAELLNHLIGLDQHVLWYYKANLLRSLKVDENLELGGELNR
jgi:hypothetical protein